jgi:hypothetical protein
MQWKPKRAKSAFSKHSWIALAAHDLNPLRMDDVATRFLSVQFHAVQKSGALVSDPKGRRRTYNKLHTLRERISSIVGDLEKSAT